MPAKTVTYQQQPILATDLLRILHRRPESGVGDILVEAVYRIRDEAGVVRGHGQWSGTVANYPISGATILAGCNAQEGT